MARNKSHRKHPCKRKGYCPPVPVHEQKPAGTLAEMMERWLKYRAEFIGTEKWNESAERRR